jgi:hypothetical protein
MRMFSAEFKAKVAFEAIQRHLTVAERPSTKSIRHRCRALVDFRKLPSLGCAAVFIRRTDRWRRLIRRPARHRRIVI